MNWDDSYDTVKFWMVTDADFKEWLAGLAPARGQIHISPKGAKHDDLAVVEAWSPVRLDDVVWVLGDVCISKTSWVFALRLLSTLPGRKRLICGNHDPVSSIHRDAWKFQRDALEVFETVQDFGKVKMAGGYALMSHYPYSGVGSEGPRGQNGEPKEERFAEFRLPDLGFPLIHGHTHGKEKLHFSESGTPEVHVGLDAWNMQLVPQHDIEKLILDAKSESARVDS